VRQQTMMNNTINAAIQVLPRSKDKHPYAIVDIAIEVIKNSGLKYIVCPFETVIEGKYDDVMKIISDIHTACYDAGADEIICNLKIQTAKIDVSIHDKMQKYY
jgi:uncharacterized protein (TIGR00106 family)